MAEWDFQSPDIAYGEAEYIWQDWPAGEPEPDRTYVVLRLQKTRRLFALRVHAYRANLSAIMCCTYYVWKCTHEYKGRRCDYAPGHEDMPPLPGQRCYNCGGIRADEIPLATEVCLG